MKTANGLLILAVCCLGRPAFSFEDELLAVLRLSPVVRELALQQAKTEQAASMQGLGSWPAVYLAAPQLYTLALPPEPVHTATAALGIQYALPFGLGLDVFWQHQLVYTPLLADKSNEHRVGFFQPVEAGVKLSVPLVFSPYINSSLKISTSMRQLGNSDLALGISELVDQFIQSWFDLYRLKEQHRLAQTKLALLKDRKELLRDQVASGLLALHVVWESERQYRTAEIQLIQITNDYADKRNQFYIDYGMEYPEHPQLPLASFSFDSYGIVPVLLINHLRQDQEKGLLDARWRSQASASAPALLISAAFKGSDLSEPTNFKESFSANFKNLNDWKPVFSIGFSVSTKDIGSEVIGRKDARLDSALLDAEHSARNSADRIRYMQLLSLREQYRSYLKNQQQSLTEVELYHADMARQAERGAIDALELGDVALLLAELQAEAVLIQTHWLEAVLRCRLLAGPD